MIRTTIATLACALATLPAISTRADPYDECILTHFSTSQDRSALNEIERACLTTQRWISRPIWPRCKCSQMRRTRMKKPEISS
jgi:hypothetical protein